MLHDILWLRWSQRARDTMEDLMATQPYQFQSEFALRHYARGFKEGFIEACRDLAVLDEWLRRAVAASSIDDVLVDRG